MSFGAPLSLSFDGRGLLTNTSAEDTWLRKLSQQQQRGKNACGQVPSTSCSLLETLRPKGGNSRKSNSTQRSLGTEEGNGTELPPAIAREAHKYFDQVVIAVKAGDGGTGSLLKLPPPSTGQKAAGKKARALQKAKQKAGRGGLKREADGEVVLPMGGHGADVILYADEFSDTLLHLHKRKSYVAKRGGNVNAADGLTRRVADGVSGDPLRIPVPVGTVVKRKRGGKFLADLSKPGDEIVVARGGRGGISIMEISEKSNSLRPRDAPDGATVATSDKALTIGLPGEDIGLELTLRVVADVGLVGFPNAGKSSLLAAVTAAKPDIAAYPFTTLMPNLGRMEGDPMADDRTNSTSATLADLPGLIEGAHLGKGLGRMFLRHLRRTRVLLHLVDASAPDPVQDYWILREELRMYNEEYTRRPHIVVLNKLDLPEAASRFEEIKAGVLEKQNQKQSGLYEESVSENGGGTDKGQTGEGNKNERTRLVSKEETLKEYGVHREKNGRGRQERVRGWEGNAVLEHDAILSDKDNEMEEEFGRKKRGESTSESGQSMQGSDSRLGTENRFEEEEDIWQGADRSERERGSREVEAATGISQMDEFAAESQRQEGEGEGEREVEATSPGKRSEPPVAILGISAKEGRGIEDLLKAIRKELAQEQMGNNSGTFSGQKGRRLTTPQWQI